MGDSEWKGRAYDTGRRDDGRKEGDGVREKTYKMRAAYGENYIRMSALLK